MGRYRPIASAHYGRSVLPALFVMFFPHNFVWGFCSRERLSAGFFQKWGSVSHLHTFSSSHLLIFTPSLTPSHFHICSSSHLLIFRSSLTSAHLHICSSLYLLSHLLSHLLIFTSAHLHIFSHIFSHICSSSHLLIFTSSLTSAHLHICSSSHLLIFTPSLTSSHLHILSSFSPFSLSRLLYLSLFRPRVVPAGSHET